jgi:hypothetical protein
MCGHNGVDANASKADHLKVFFLFKKYMEESFGIFLYWRPSAVAGYRVTSETKAIFHAARR